jgi:hypothetical protein
LFLSRIIVARNHCEKDEKNIFKSLIHNEKQVAQ